MKNKNIKPVWRTNLLEILKTKLGFKTKTPSNKDFSTFVVSKQELNDIALKVERFNEIQEGKVKRIE